MIEVVPEQHSMSEKPRPPLLPAGYTPAASSASTAASTLAAQVPETTTVSANVLCFLASTYALQQLQTHLWALDILSEMPSALEQSLYGQRFSVQVLQARKLLKAAISKSHPPTARYIVEAAAACLDHGLQATAQGLVLEPVAWSLLASAVKQSYPENTKLLDRLHGSVGQKYFKLLGTTPSGQPEFVTALLDILIISSHRPAVSHLLTGVYAGSPKQSKQSVLSGQQPALL